MRTAVFLLLAGTSWADSSGYQPILERLGNGYSYVGSGEDRGLDVEEWQNETLHRREFWHKPPGGEYFVRINETTYVHGLHQGGEWKTDPSLKLVHRDGRWRRLNVREGP